jgi:hypothetical protein
MNRLYEMIEYYKDLKNKNPKNREANLWLNIYLKEKKRSECNYYKIFTTINKL